MVRNWIERLLDQSALSLGPTVAQAATPTVVTMAARTVVPFPERRRIATEEAREAGLNEREWIAACARAGYFEVNGEVSGIPTGFVWSSVDRLM